MNTKKQTRFDPKHFCPSWGACCEQNLSLKPKHPKVSSNMSLEDAFHVNDVILKIWHDNCSKSDATYESCIKAILTSESDYDNMIKALSQCKCCERHQVHCPVALDDRIWKSHVRRFADDIDEFGDYWYTCGCEPRHKPKNFYKCDCVCRHSIRLIQNCFYIKE